MKLNISFKSKIHCQTFFKCQIMFSKTKFYSFHEIIHVVDCEIRCLRLFNYFTRVRNLNDDL